MAALAYPIRTSTERRASQRGAPRRRTAARAGGELRLVGSATRVAPVAFGGLDERGRELPRLAPITPIGPRHRAVERHLPDRDLPERGTPAARPVGGRARAASALGRSRSQRRIVSLSSTLVTLSVLGGLWFGAGALGSLRHEALAVLPGSTATAGGYLYRVQAGDTLWSIATRIEGSGDTRPLVAQLEAELHGSTLQPGAQLLVP